MVFNLLIPHFLDFGYVLSPHHIIISSICNDSYIVIIRINQIASSSTKMIKRMVNL
ncbi:hypothetical protein Lalb_Chr18g0044611 [Lupinus albus]|uniref:Uncharacterized protein n=1 Tax=Lupinus albus TaxID=3870 RepID=A0A6A4NN85_LUPAL|nr:hypothetical protein Lalb_Chr18g0044611 [Lupinus albus]